MGFLDWVFSRNPATPDARLLTAVDRVLQGIDPRLKYLHGAREQLVPVVQQVLAFARETIATLPPAIPLSPENWSHEPLLRAMFARPAELLDAIAASDDLHRFMDAASAPIPMHAVVAATRVERTVLGMGLAGGQLRQDVAQRTISFSDFHIAAVAADEAGTRRAVEDFVLEQLVLAALAEIADERRHGAALQCYRQLLMTRLRLMEQSGANLDALFARGEEESDLDRLRRELAENEAALAALDSAHDLDRALEHLIDALRQAETIIRPQQLRMRIDAMNVVVEGEDEGASLDLFEFSTANPDRPRRVAFLATIAPSDVRQRHMDFDAALRSL